MSSVGEQIRMERLINALKGKDISDLTIVLGTCKDCQHRGAIYANGECYCDNDGTLRECNFYCKDFIRRGCTDCEEYNQEKHYCPKFCDVIRETTKEMQEFYKGEHEKLEKIEQIVKKELSPLSIDEMSNAEIQIKEVLEQE